MVDKHLDCVGLLCPLPVLKARRALAGMQVGAVLEVATTDRMALIDLPHFCAEQGHYYLSASEDQGISRHLIKVGAGKDGQAAAWSATGGDGA